MSTVLHRAKALLGKSEAHVRDLLGEELADHPKSNYEKLGGLHELSSSAFPGSIYLADGAVRLVYVPGDNLDDVEPKSLRDAVSGHAHELRSRAGKMSTLYLYAADGLAFSATDDSVDFLEVFPSCTVEEYVDQVYNEPPAFKR